MPQLRPIIGVGMSFFVLVIFLVLALGLRKKSKAPLRANLKGGGPGSFIFFKL
jgi:galactitol-specific phosphotransferase system IIC component